MNGRMHFMLGMAVGCSAAITFYEDPADAAFFAAGTMIGSLLPDIDQPTSKIGHLVPPVSIILNKIFGHRGFIHTPVFLVILALLFYRAAGPVPIAVGVCVGYALHLLQDLFTRGGIMLLFPISRKRFRIGRAKSGSCMDFVTTCFLAVMFSFSMTYFIK